METKITLVMLSGGAGFAHFADDQSQAKLAGREGVTTWFDEASPDQKDQPKKW